ncbi:MAG: BACON domain-containing protein [Bacteroidales bacterium]|jgi:hypothetical protein|nr:BACON domain-containing protein [Bacteroidales bacterium]HPM10561.1 BACON domain-containing protein [Paludibacter sp.]
MRKIIIFCFLVFFVGCEKEPFLTVTPSTVDFTAGGGKQTFSISCNNDWNAVLSGNSFLTLSTTQGVEGAVDVTLTALENKDVKDRNATVTVSSAGLSKIIEVIQAGAAPSISLDKTNVQIAVDGDAFSLNVSTNGAPWTIGDVPDWMTFSPVNGTGNTVVNVSVKKNSMAVEREAAVVFLAESATAQLKVKQSAASATLEIDKEYIEVGAGENTIKLSVTTNSATWVANDVPEWVAITPKSGSQSEEIQVVVAVNPSVNPRSCVIVFSAGDIFRELVIKQEGSAASINLDKSSRNVPASATSFTLQVITNDAAWSVGDIPEWVSLDSFKGDKSATLTIEVDENTIAKTRSAEIAFYAGDASVILEIVQEAAEVILSIDTHQVELTASDSTFVVNLVINEAEWEVSGIPEWVHLTPSRGNVNAEIVVTIEQNTVVNERSASVLFTAGSKTETLQIIQAGAEPTITLSTTEISAEYTGETFEVVVTTNGLNWEIDQIADWISFDKATGNSGESLKIQVEKNLSLDERTGAIVFASGISTATLTVQQDSFYRAVEITYAYLRDPNSVGGCDAVVVYSNLSDKTIKYFIWRGYALNAVGDKVMCTVRDTYYFAGKDTGPYEPGETLCGGKWGAMIYNSSARKLVIYEISIEYMDGSIILYEGEDEVNLLIKEGYNGERLPFDGWDSPPKPNGVIPLN